MTDTAYFVDSDHRDVSYRESAVIQQEVLSLSLSAGRQQMGCHEVRCPVMLRLTMHFLLNITLNTASTSTLWLVTTSRTPGTALAS